MELYEKIHKYVAIKTFKLNNFKQFFDTFRINFDTPTCLHLKLWMIPIEMA